MIAPRKPTLLLCLLTLLALLLLGGPVPSISLAQQHEPAQQSEAGQPKATLTPTLDAEADAESEHRRDFVREEGGREFATDAPTARPPESDLAPTYTIFATREGLVGRQTANGHIIRPRDRFVALPSWSALSSYQGYEFQVRLTYQGRSVVAPVWDVGPWNTNDPYWQADRGPYSDLPVGLPAAQAAYQHGYNGGRDQYGRMVGLPNGIDIADGTFWDDLGMYDNDWVQVTFLWLGEDPGPGSAVDITPPPVAFVPPTPTVPLATPRLSDNPLALLAGRQAPDEPPPTVVDNVSTQFDGGSAAWAEERCGVNGSHGSAATTASAANQQQAIWRPAVQPDIYEILAYIPPCGDNNATRAARYVITHDYGSDAVMIDQQAAAGTWVSLGIFHFGAGTPPVVAVSNAAPASDGARVVRIDAMAWMPMPDPERPAEDVRRSVMRLRDEDLRPDIAGGDRYRHEPVEITVSHRQLQQAVRGVRSAFGSWFGSGSDDE
jgi:hypothetical protein